MVFPFLGSVDINSFCGLLFSRCLVVSDLFSLCIVCCYCGNILGLVSTEAVLSVLWVIGQNSDFDVVPACLQVVRLLPHCTLSTSFQSQTGSLFRERWTGYSVVDSFQFTVMNCSGRNRLAACLGRGGQAIQSWTPFNSQ